MCGIAGYSFHRASRVDRTLAAQALLAGIAERGADAAGYAYRGPAEDLWFHKQRSGASALLDRLAIPQEANQAILHVRDYTKGHPGIEANNHPVRHGAVKGIHNGIIVNDEEIFDRYGFERHEPDMTVDSEAIFALVDAYGPTPEVLEELCGSMATAWFDEREPDTVYIARGVGRPLWLGEGLSEAFFASTKKALEIVEQYLGRDASQARAARGDPRPAHRGPPAEGDPLPARQRLRRDAAAGRSSAPGRRYLPAPPRRDRGRLSRPSADTSTPSSSSRSRTRYWNAAHAPLCGSSIR